MGKHIRNMENKYGEETITITISGVDMLTVNKLTQRVFPEIRRIITESEKESRGEIVKKPCGCGEVNGTT